jgi:hypothetical protein
MSVLVGAGMAPHSYLLTTKGRKPAGHAATPWSSWNTTAGVGWSLPTGRCRATCLLT